MHEAIPEEHEPTQPQHKQSEDAPPSDSDQTPPEGPTWGQGGRGCLALSPAATAGVDEIPPDMRGEGATKKPWPPKPVQHQLAEAGPPSQRTWQMEKDLEKHCWKGTRKLRLRKRERRKNKSKKRNHEGCSPDWRSHCFLLHVFLVFMFIFSCANTPCCLHGDWRNGWLPIIHLSRHPDQHLQADTGHQWFLRKGHSLAKWLWWEKEVCCLIGEIRRQCKQPCLLLRSSAFMLTDHLSAGANAQRCRQPPRQPQELANMATLGWRAALQPHTATGSPGQVPPSHLDWLHHPQRSFQYASGMVHSLMLKQLSWPNKWIPESTTPASPDPTGHPDEARWIGDRPLGGNRRNGTIRDHKGNLLHPGSWPDLVAFLHPEAHKSTPEPTSQTTFRWPPW